MKELVGISESHCEIMYYITRHVLSVISLKVSKEHADRDGVNLKYVDESDKPSKVIETIDQWLLHKACVGHVKFGGSHLKKFEEEVCVSIFIALHGMSLASAWSMYNYMQVWRVLCKDTLCPENIKVLWIKAVEQLLEKRVKKVTMQSMHLHHKYLHTLYIN